LVGERYLFFYKTQILARLALFYRLSFSFDLKRSGKEE
jgi:hypothetical protein